MSKTSVEEFLSCISNHLDKKLLEKLAVAGELTLRLCLFYKVVSTKLPAYIYDFIPPVRQSQTFNYIQLLLLQN